MYGFTTQCCLTIRLPPVGLGKILLGSMCVAQLQGCNPYPVQCFGIPWSSLQYEQAVLLDTGIINILFLEQTGWALDNKQKK